MAAYSKGSLTLRLALILIVCLAATKADARHHRGRHFYVESGTIVANPSGCPSRAFCGCGASIRVFGRSIRSLWLASNWFRFPRTSPSPGMVAVRQHHVFVLESQIKGNVWTVYDANSGGHATRIHARSIAGYTIVNPHA